MFNAKLQPIVQLVWFVVPWEPISTCVLPVKPILTVQELPQSVLKWEPSQTLVVDAKPMPTVLLHPETFATTLAPEQLIPAVNVLLMVTVPLDLMSAVLLETNSDYA